MDIGPVTVNKLNYSYLMRDDCNGNVCIYFTYYSEFGRHRDAVSGVEVTAIAILFLLSMFGNTAVLVELVRKNHSNKVPNFFLGNLALSDNIFVLTAPLIAITRITQSWLLGEILCHISMYTLFVCGFVLIWTMAIISVERYLLIVRQQSRPVSHISARRIITAEWFVAILSLLPIAMYFELRRFSLDGCEIYICTFVWRDSDTERLMSFSAFLLVIGFFIPLIVMSVNYFRIFKTFWKSRNAVLSRTTSSARTRSAPTVGGTKTTSYRNRRNERDFRIVRMLFLLVGLFLLMWSPVFICLLGISLDNITQRLEMRSEYILAVTCIAYANTVVNPVIYGLINRTLALDVSRCTCCPVPRRWGRRRARVDAVSPREPGNKDGPLRSAFTVGDAERHRSIVTVSEQTLHI